MRNKEKVGQSLEEITLQNILSIVTSRSCFVTHGLNNSQHNYFILL